MIDIAIYGNEITETATGDFAIAVNALIRYYGGRYQNQMGLINWPNNISITKNYILMEHSEIMWGYPFHHLWLGWLLYEGPSVVKGTTFDTKWPGDHLWQPYINQGTILGSTSVAISRSVTVRFTTMALEYKAILDFKNNLYALLRIP